MSSLFNNHFKEISDLDKKLCSSNIQEQYEAISSFYDLVQKYPNPVVINSLILKFTDLFCNGTNLIRYHILQVFLEINLIPENFLNPFEAISRIQLVTESNDPIARALAIRMFGTPSLNMNANRQFGLPHKMCAQSPVFAKSILEMIENNIQNEVYSSLDNMIIFSSLLKHMYHDSELAKKAYQIGINLLYLFPSHQFVLPTLKSMNVFISKILVLVPNFIIVLMTYISYDPRKDIRLVSLKMLNFLLVNHFSQLDSLWKLVLQSLLDNLKGVVDLQIITEVMHCIKSLIWQYLNSQVSCETPSNLIPQKTNDPNLEIGFLLEQSKKYSWNLIFHLDLEISILSLEILVISTKNDEENKALLQYIQILLQQMKNNPNISSISHSQFKRFLSCLTTAIQTEKAKKTTAEILDSSLITTQTVYLKQLIDFLFLVPHHQKLIANCLSELVYLNHSLMLEDDGLIIQKLFLHISSVLTQQQNNQNSDKINSNIDISKATNNIHYLTIPLFQTCKLNNFVLSSENISSLIKNEKIQLKLMIPNIEMEIENNSNQEIETYHSNSDYENENQIEIENENQNQNFSYLFIFQEILSISHQIISSNNAWIVYLFAKNAFLQGYEQFSHLLFTMLHQKFPNDKEYFIHIMSLLSSDPDNADTLSKSLQCLNSFGKKESLRFQKKFLSAKIKMQKFIHNLKEILLQSEKNDQETKSNNIKKEFVSKLMSLQDLALENWENYEKIKTMCFDIDKQSYFIIEVYQVIASMIILSLTKIVELNENQIQKENQFHFHSKSSQVLLFLENQLVKNIQMKFTQIIESPLFASENHQPQNLHQLLIWFINNYKQNQLQFSHFVQILDFLSNSLFLSLRLPFPKYFFCLKPKLSLNFSQIQPSEIQSSIIEETTITISGKIESEMEKLLKNIQFLEIEITSQLINEQTKSNITSNLDSEKNKENIQKKLNQKFSLYSKTPFISKYFSISKLINFPFQGHWKIDIKASLLNKKMAKFQTGSKKSLNAFIK
ncbi:hypothetical protein M0811_12475 [Anaeramoeba ignava]|uniref:Integrator complex subunit 7 n=1 Tax=Anaeramoeba ignava TaxID=1746090 RepID=A0A9Q0R6H2_ANAIG|nr:hypothetical protein M0811_12475 [Anaeramoeba ignava]